MVFYLFYAQSNHKLSLQYQASPIYKKFLLKNKKKYLHSFLHYLHICWLLLMVYPLILLYSLYMACNHDIFD